MKQNVGAVDKFIRIAIGVMLLALIFVLDGDARWWGLLGLVPLLTGLFGRCPLYSLIGINSCPAASTSGR
jgi:hypothetical protein